MVAGRNNPGMTTTPLFEREQVLPLLVGLVIAIVLHGVAIVPVVGGRFALWGWAASDAKASSKIAVSDAAHPTAKTLAPKLPDPSRKLSQLDKPEAKPLTPRQRAELKQKKEDEIRFGRDNGSPTSVAWIAYDDYRELMARKGTTEQPALQNKVTPTEGAPIRPDPTPARPALASAGARPSPPPSPAMPALAAKPASSSLIEMPKPVAPPAPSAGEKFKPVPYAPEKSAPPRVIAATPPAPEPKPADTAPKLVAAAITPVPAEVKPITAKPIIAPPPKTGSEVLVSSEISKPAPPPTTAKPVETPPVEKPATTGALAMVTPKLETELLIPKPDAHVGEPIGMGAAQKQATPATRPAEQASKPLSPLDLLKASIGSPGASASPSSAKPASAGSPVAEPGEAARPTGAPRADSESSPVSLTGADPLKVRAGRVIAGEGITIETAFPQISAVARATSIPTNPVVRVEFDKDGTVRNAEILKSSNYPNIDGPILASLYKWHAKGEKLKELNRAFDMTILIVLIDE